MKSFTQIHFGSQVPREGIPIAYIQTPKLYSSDVVSIIDKSDLISQNTFFEKAIQIKLTKDILTYFVDKTSFLITDKFRGQKPLYFKHEIQNPIFLDANGTTDIMVIDINGVPQNDAFYLFDCGKRVVYHALDSSQVFFVIYSRADENNHVIELKCQELLSTRPAFSPYTATDLDSEGNIKPDCDGYKLEELDGQPYLWRLTLPRPTNYSLQYTSRGLFRLSIPQLEVSDPWYIEVNDTVLLTKQFQQDLLLKYAITEFEVQNFYPFPPLMIVAEKEAKIISPTVVDVGAQGLIQTTKTPIDIKIFNPNGILSQAFTTDHNKLGIKIQNINWEVDSIESIDLQNGRISLRRKIQPGETVKVSFYYEVTTYQYTGYNFNPLYNPSVLEQKVAILCKPFQTGILPSLSHIVLDFNDNIIEVSDIDIDKWNTGNKTWDNLITDWLYIPGQSYSNNNNYMLLGFVRATIPLAIEQATILDARRRGGGIDNLMMSTALNAVPTAIHNWDIKQWDGPNQPLQGAILLYIPEYTRTVFTENEIRARVAKYAAAGSYFVIRYF
jgi:hypothetical protein